MEVECYDTIPQWMCARPPYFPLAVSRVDFPARLVFKLAVAPLFAETAKMCYRDICQL